VENLCGSIGTFKFISTAQKPFAKFFYLHSCVSSGSGARFLQISQRRAGKGIFLNPHKPLGTPSRNQVLGRVKGRARSDYPPKKPVGKPAQKTTSLILSACSLLFPHCVSVCNSGINYGQEPFEAQLHLIHLHMWQSEGPGNREEASSTCLDILGLLEMPLGLASRDKRNYGVKPSASQQ